MKTRQLRKILKFLTPLRDAVIELILAIAPPPEDAIEVSTPSPGTEDEIPFEETTGPEGPLPRCDPYGAPDNVISFPGDGSMTNRTSGNGPENM